MMNKFDIDQPLHFKKGIYDLNDNEDLNFQFNRIVNWDGGDLDEIRTVSCNVKTLADWKTTLLKLGKKAETEERIEPAIAYYRMAEFYIPYDDPVGIKAYRHSRKLFYEYYEPCFSSGLIERLDAPFEDISLPVWHLKAENSKGVFVFHGGYDSYMEEFIIPVLYLREKGYEVYMFEGPGQGSVLREQNRPLIAEWEKPVSAVLDAFGLAGVTLCGCSLGGYYAPRAAAFDKRIKRVIAWSVFPSLKANVVESGSALAWKGVMAIPKLGLGGITKTVIEKGAQKGDAGMMLARDMMHKAGAEKVGELVNLFKRLDLEPIADKIDQDVLLVGASEDTICSNRMTGQQINMLGNARSVTYRMITRKEEGSDHCNAGNTKLALDVMCQWMRNMDELGY